MSNSIVTVQKLNKSIGKKQVLDDVSFEITAGHIVGLIGANGAGKTTIMRALLGITGFSGEILLNGQTNTVTKHQALVNVGALIEYPGLYPFLTGRQQLKLFATGPDQTVKVEQVVQQLQLQDYIDTKTKDYSVGMKQKLGIALALVNRPNFVILDEPMNGLDPQATKELRDLILTEQAAGTTFLISSHILGELQKLAEDVLIIDHGHLIRATTMEELLSGKQGSYLIATPQAQQTLKLLQAAGYQVSISQSRVRVLTEKGPEVSKILKLLADHEIVINDVQQQSRNLEESLLDLLNDDPQSTLGTGRLK